MENVSKKERMVIHNKDVIQLYSGNFTIDKLDSLERHDQIFWFYICYTIIANNIIYDKNDTNLTILIIAATPNGMKVTACLEELCELRSHKEDFTYEPVMMFSKYPYN
jgi:hypothetical protein